MSHIGDLVSHIKSDLTRPGAASTVDSPEGAPHDTIDEWGVFASTTEALTLTILTELVRRAGEHLFVNTYLLGVTTFAAAGHSTYARYAAELAANESEHRLLGQTLAGANPPNDLGFAEFEFDRVSQIAAAAQSAGFGFGEQGTAAGRFYDLAQSPMAPPIQISSNEPR